MSTDWSPSLEGMKSTTLELAMDVLPPDDRWTLMLSIGIEYGSFRENGKIKEVPRFGAAKIVALQGKEPGSKYDSQRDDDTDTKEDTPNVVSEEASLKAMSGVEDYPTPEVRYTYVRKETAGKKKPVEIYCYTIQVDSIASPENATVRNVDRCKRKDQSAKLESGLRRRSVIQPGATGGGVAIGDYCYLQSQARDVALTFYHGVPVDG